MTSNRFESRTLFPYARPQQSPSPKPPLHPTCAVFSDSIPDMSSSSPPPPPPLSPSQYPSSPQTPPHASHDLFDHFKTHDDDIDGDDEHQPYSPSHPAVQLSSAAPLGSVTDDEPQVKHPDDLMTGTWYAVSRGLQTSAGSKLFAEQRPLNSSLQAQPQRRPRFNDGSSPLCPNSDIEQSGCISHGSSHKNCQQRCLYCSKCLTTRCFDAPNNDHPSSSNSVSSPSPSSSLQNTPSTCITTRSPSASTDYTPFTTPTKKIVSRLTSSSQPPTPENSTSNMDNQQTRNEQECYDHDLWSRPLIPCIVDSLPQSGSNSAAAAVAAAQAAAQAAARLQNTNPPVEPPPVEMVNDNLSEITADQAADGADVQGIPWQTLPFSRADYRATRLTDQTRVPRDSHDFGTGSNEGHNYHLKEPNRSAQYYDFFSNTRSVKCSIVHFQLRNLAWATSKHDVYVMHDASVVHWDGGNKRKTKVLDLSGSDLSVRSGLIGLGPVQISTMIARDNLVIAGGFYGEMVAKNMTNGCVIHSRRITFDENAITNAIDIFDDTIMTSSNDCYVRCFDIRTFERKNQFRFNHPVNHATRQPNGKMVVVASDEDTVQVIDGDSGDNISHLRGHVNFSFATGWHPNGRLFATGSQDHTCRIWDIRNMSHHVSVLGAHMGAVRSLRFSSCGRFMVMAEPRDFVHIYDVNRGLFDTCQEIDLFGEIAGIALTPNAEGLYIAVSDRLYSSLLEYERRDPSSMVSDLML